jgi:undecaprenyl-diphosphatase
MGNEPRGPLDRLRAWTRSNPSELTLVLFLAGIALLAGGFLVLADEVMEGDTHAFDQAILLAFRSPGHPELPLGPIWLQEMARDITALGSFALLGLVVAAVLGYLMFAGDRLNAGLIAVSVGGGVLISQVLKSTYDRPRPDIAASAHEFTASFPSGHAMLSSIVYLTLGALLARATPGARLRSFFLAFPVLLTLLVGVSRVYLGVHYPTDVLAGWSLGAAWAGLCLVAGTRLIQPKIPPSR